MVIIDELPPPSYNDVVRENDRFQRVDRLFHITQAVFTVLNFALSGMIGFALFLIKYSKVITMHKMKVQELCKDPNFNFPLPVLNNSFAISLPMAIFLILCMVMFIKARFERIPWRSALKKTFIQLWTFLTHLGFLLVTLELLTLSVGLPAPYYFSSVELKEWYCSDSKEEPTKGMSYELNLMDESFRTSFPSYRAAIYSFCTIFLYLYVDHFDVIPGIHATQQCIAMVLSCYSCHYIVKSLQRGENHFIDILVGATLGLLQGIAAIRNIFGSVFYKRTHIGHENLETIIECIDMNVTEMQPIVTQCEQIVPERRRSYQPTRRSNNFYPSLYDISEV